MRWSLKIGRVNGAPVEVHWLFVLLVAWAGYEGWTQGQWLGLVYTTGMLLATFGCVLLHEIGHTVQAQAIGIPVRRIVLLPFGGLAQLAQLPERPRDELRVAVAGPMVNIALTLLAGGLLALWIIAGGAPLPTWPQLLAMVERGQAGGLQFLAVLAFVNAALVAFNLLPAFPLDGGRILRSALALVLPRAAATRAVTWLGWVLGGLCLLLATNVARVWGEPAALSMLVTGGTAILGSGAEETSERNQASLREIPVWAAVRQPTWCLRPAEPLTPGLLSVIEALNRPALPVVSEGRLVGVVTRRDLTLASGPAGALTVANIMRGDFVQVAAGADLWRAQQLMWGAGQETLPVMDGDRLHGMLTSADIRAAFVAPPSLMGGEAPQLISANPSSL